MRRTYAVGWLAIACVVIVISACGGSTPAPPPPAATSPANDAAKSEDAQATDTADAASEAEDVSDASLTAVVVDGEASKQAPSTMSYEQATATAEPIRLDDDRIQLTDNQLNAPMAGLLQKCRMPGRTKVTIKTAVQGGRAIGVTVLVDLNKPKPKGKPKRLTRAQAKAAAAQAKAEAKLIEKIRGCFDHAVRALTWPPSPRRDAFTTTF